MSLKIKIVFSLLYISASTLRINEIIKNKILSIIKLDSIDQQIIMNKQSKEFINQEFNFEFDE